jgi:nucleotide-binding universal stress UspA family protein
MFSITRVLLPVDLSERCRGAASYAAAIACHFHAEVTVLHCLEPALKISGFEGPALSDEWYATQRACAQEELDRFFWEELRHVKHQYIVVEGDPAREIVKCAASAPYDLIVMPTHGYGPFRRFLLGSVTAKVLHDTACAVLTGPHMEHAPEPVAIGFGNLLCAIDLGPESTAVLEWAQHFAAAYGATLTVLHAISVSELRLGPVYFDPEWRNHASAAARQRITESCGNAQPSGGLYIAFADPPAAIHEKATLLDAKLVIIGRSHANGIAGRLRANAYAIVREAPCAVVSV